MTGLITPSVTAPRKQSGLQREGRANFPVCLVPTQCPLPQAEANWKVCPPLAEERFPNPWSEFPQKRMEGKLVCREELLTPGSGFF